MPTEIGRKELRILLDLDGTITHDPKFFSIFCVAMQSVAEIHVVTHRPEEQQYETEEELKALGIRYDYLTLTPDKLAYALDKGINVVFEDFDHYIKYMPANITCFKIREKDNWHSKSRRWIYNDTNGIHEEDLR
jgi:hypothetical protein